MLSLDTCSEDCGVSRLAQLMHSYSERMIKMRLFSWAANCRGVLIFLLCKTYKKMLKQLNKEYFSIKMLYSMNTCHLVVAAAMLWCLKRLVMCCQYGLGWIDSDSLGYFCGCENEHK